MRRLAAATRVKEAPTPPYKGPVASVSVLTLLAFAKPRTSSTPMIVTCPACSSRYKFDEDRLNGRSAKITCPSCDHVFVTHPPTVEPALHADTWPSEAMDEASAASVLGDAPPNIRTADFGDVGITWKVRQGLGVMHDYHTLEELEEELEDGVISHRDSLAYDGRHFQPIDSIDDLTEHFRDVWERAARGDVKTEDTATFVIGDDADDEDEDAPTTIVRTSSAFNLNLDAAMDMADGNAPPPPAPLQVTPMAGTPGTTGRANDPLSQSSTDVASSVAAGEAKKAAAADAGSSKLPMFLLFVVTVVAIGGVAAYLWSQGILLAPGS